MTGHFENERRLQGQMERELARDLPDVDVLDVELDAPHQLVRLFIDSAEGVTHELCARVTGVVRDTCPDFALEVSSPGSERPLRRREHFEAARGGRVKLRQRGGKRPFSATIVDVDDRGVIVRRDDDTEQHVAFDDIVRTHLIPGSDDAAVGGATSTTQARGR